MLKFKSIFELFKFLSHPKTWSSYFIFGVEPEKASDCHDFVTYFSVLYNVILAVCGGVRERRKLTFRHKYVILDGSFLDANRSLCRQYVRPSTIFNS